MTDSELYTGAIDALQAYLATGGLNLTVAETESGLSDFDAVDIVLGDSRARFRFTVFDEYGDLDDGSTLLALVLLRFGMDGLEDAEGVEDWARAESLDPEAADVRETYRRNCETRDAIAMRFEPPPDVVTSMDWELNAGLAQHLRRIEAG